MTASEPVAHLGSPDLVAVDWLPLLPPLSWYRGTVEQALARTSAGAQERARHG